MDASPCDSPVRKNVYDYYRLSNDTDRSDPVIVPDVFGLRAFGSESPDVATDTGLWDCLGVFS